MSWIIQWLIASNSSWPVYRFEDNFNTLDTGIWTVVWWGSVSWWIYTQTWTSSAPTKSITNISNIVTWDFILEFRASSTQSSASWHYLWLSNASSNMLFCSVWNMNSTNTLIINSVWWIINLTNFHDNTYHIWKIQRIWSTITYYIDWVLKYTETWWNTTDYKFYAQNWDNAEQVNIDYIRVT